MGEPLIVIVGGGLPGLAAAARLAKAGHHVSICERDPALGAGIQPAAEPGGEVVTLPAAWRDLFRKSGRPLDAELSRHRLRMVAAPPRLVRFADQTSLAWPSDRAEQWTALREAYGEAPAVAWRDLVDGLVPVWQLVRGLGLEAEFTEPAHLTAWTRAVLQPRRSLARLAAEQPFAQLGELILDVAARLGQDPRRLPAWHAYRLVVERTFGRWQVVDDAGRPRPAATLVDLLVERLRQRSVAIHTRTEVVALRSYGDRWQVRTTGLDLDADLVISTVPPATHGQLTRDRIDLRLAQRLRPAAVEGPLWRSWRTLLDLPTLQPSLPGVLVASAWSPGGPDAWAQLLTGALAGYRAHAHLTGVDIRPRADPRATRRTSGTGSAQDRDLDLDEQV